MPLEPLDMTRKILASLLPAALAFASPLSPPAPQASQATTLAPTAAPTASAVSVLYSDLVRLIHGTGWQDARWSVMAVSLDVGDTIFAYNPDLELAPASNMKLFTSAAALRYLGPNYRYGTYLC